MLAAASGPEEAEEDDDEEEDEEEDDEEEPSAWRRLPASAVASARCESRADAPDAVPGRTAPEAPAAVKYAPLLRLPPF